MPTTGTLRWREPVSVEVGVAVVEHPAVACREPVPAAAGCGGHADHRCVEAEAPGAPAEVLPEREDAAVGAHGEVAVLGRVGALARPERVAAADEARQLGVVMELGPAARLVDRGAVGPGHLEVLRDALHRTARAQCVVPRQRDADGAVGVARDQRRVLEPHGPGRAVVTRTVVEVGHLGAGLPVEDLDAEVGRHNDVLVPGPQVGGRHRPVDGAEHGGVPDGLAGGGVERPYRARRDRRRRALGRPAGRCPGCRPAPGCRPSGRPTCRSRPGCTGCRRPSPCSRRWRRGRNFPCPWRCRRRRPGGWARRRATSPPPRWWWRCTRGRRGRCRCGGARRRRSGSRRRSRWTTRHRDEVVGTRAVEVTDGGGGEDASAENCGHPAAGAPFVVLSA